MTSDDPRLPHSKTQAHTKATPTKTPSTATTTLKDPHRPTPEHHPSEATTLDTFFDGALRIVQSRQGYRFSIDALLLGATAHGEDNTILDAGCGSGVVGLMAAIRNPEAQVLGVEIQPALATAAQRSVTLSGLEARVQIVQADLREVAQTGKLPTHEPLKPCGLVLMNPPYFPAQSGLLNPHQERAAARHEQHGTLAELLRACRRLLTRTGRLRLIYPAPALPRLMRTVEQAGLKPIRLRPIHPFPNTPARLVLLEARQAGRRELELAPGVCIHTAPGHYHPEVRALLDGEPVVL
ncbi:MAG: methyltransferase [Myxococcota bacterium]